MGFPVLSALLKIDSAEILSLLAIVLTTTSSSPHLRKDSGWDLHCSS